MDDDGLVETDLRIKKRQMEKIERANERLFARECEEKGIDPELGISPSLMRWIESKKAPTP